MAFVAIPNGLYTSNLAVLHHTSVCALDRQLSASSFHFPSEGDVAYTQCCTARKLSDVYSTLALLAIVFGALLRFISVYVAGRRHF